MKNVFKKVLVGGLLAVFVFGFSANNVLAATGEGTATINGGTSATVVISTSNTLTVVLTVGVTGIDAADFDPTFTIPTGFTAPHAAGGAVVPTAIGEVDVDGEWFIAGAGGTCAVTMASSSATGQVITAAVTGACASTNTITLTYKGVAPATAMAATNFDVKTDDDAIGSVTSITTTPAHTIIVKGTAVVASHATAGVATTNNLSGLAAIGGADKVLGGFKITAAGENVDVTTIRTTVTLGTMVIGELTNLRIVPDNGTGAGDPDDGIMHADELAAPLATIASPIAGNNDFTVTSTVTAGGSNNYFIVGTLAATIADGDTIDTEATGAGSVSAGVTSVVAITPTGTSTNSTRTITETVAPTVVITLSDSVLNVAETALVTFTFSETPTGFAAADVTVVNGTLGAIDASVPTVQTATFTPTAEFLDITNIISVGTSWTDSSAGLNPPAGTTDSANFVIDTRTSGGGGGSSSGSRRAIPAVPANVEAPADCLPGFLFSPSTGRNCNAATPAVPAQGNAYAFGQSTVKMGTKGEACKAWQMFFNDKANAGLVTDGWCGKLTIGAAKSWQASMGLLADGLLGPMSRAKALME